MIWPYLFVLLFVIFASRSVYDLAGVEEFFDYFLGTLLLGTLSALVFCLGIGFGSLVGLTVSKH
ncbi:MAG: hypothetical protein UY20_C0009G0003 [Candidatus Yanofskybacteria bacterium GW2011_GWA1_48_10]|nr:MAG: hypothetical protein UY20_C0009G0003 [Candidatus Yanofskybacteria bacterium GW2011_GWA1_48_10]